MRYFARRDPQRQRMMTASDWSTSCPLCACSTGICLERIPYQTIWSELQSRHSARFSADVIARNTPAGAVTTLLECTCCGLQYFSPPLAGDAAFYSELSTPDLPYAEDRWEFAEARHSISNNQAVVDFGCGDGAFLRSLPANQKRRAGIDFFASAITNLEGSGIEGYVTDFAEFARSQPGRFDVACGFHVVEHLPQVGILVDAAVKSLRPSGRLLISVPNRERISAAGFPVLDCPPHHLSRWHPEQFDELANQFGLRLAGIRYERRTVPALKAVVRRGVPAALHVVSGLASRDSRQRRSSPRGSTARSAPPLDLVRRLGLGHAMLAEFVSP